MLTYDDIINGWESDEARAWRRYREAYVDNSLDHVCSFSYFFNCLPHLWKGEEYDLPSEAN